MQHTISIIQYFEELYQNRFPTKILFEMAKLLLIDVLAHPITQNQLSSGKISTQTIFSYCHYFIILRLGTSGQKSSLIWPATIPQQDLEQLNEKFHQRYGDRSNWDVSDVIQIELLNFQHSSYRHRLLLIDQDEASIDRDLASVIERINLAGFHTRSCCSGTLRDHPNCKPYNKQEGYISFDALDKSNKEQNISELEIPIFDQIKTKVQKLYNTPISTSLNGKSFAIQLRFPLELGDEDICNVWEEVCQFLIIHQTEINLIIPQSTPFEVIPIGDIDKIHPEAIDFVHIYRAKLDEKETILSDRQRSLIMSFYGSHLLNANEFQHALDVLQKSLEIDRLLQDQNAEAIKLNNIGTVYRELGEKDHAFQYFNMSLDIFRQLQNPDAIQKIEEKIQKLK